MANKIGKSGHIWVPKSSIFSQEYQQQIHWPRMAKNGRGHTQTHIDRQTFKYFFKTFIRKIISSLGVS